MEHYELCPLNDDDVDNEMRILADMPINQMKKLLNTYLQTINSIIVTSIHMCDDEDDAMELERLKRLVRFLPAEETFIRSKNKIWAVREQIKNRNEDFFLNIDHNKYIKNDRNKTFITNLLDIALNAQKRFSKREKDIFWNKVDTLLQCTIQFNKEKEKLLNAKCSN